MEVQLLLQSDTKHAAQGGDVRTHRHACVRIHSPHEDHLCF